MRSLIVFTLSSCEIGGFLNYAITGKTFSPPPPPGERVERAELRKPGSGDSWFQLRNWPLMAVSDGGAPWPSLPPRPAPVCALSEGCTSVARSSRRRSSLLVSFGKHLALRGWEAGPGGPSAGGLPRGVRPAGFFKKKKILMLLWLQ